MKNKDKKYTEAEFREMVEDGSWEGEQAEYAIKQDVKKYEELQQSMQTLREVQQSERESFQKAVEDITEENRP